MYLSSWEKIWVGATAGVSECAESEGALESVSEREGVPMGGIGRRRGQWGRGIGP